MYQRKWISWFFRGNWDKVLLKLICNYFIYMIYYLGLIVYAEEYNFLFLYNFMSFYYARLLFLDILFRRSNARWLASSTVTFALDALYIHYISALAVRMSLKLSFFWLLILLTFDHLLFCSFDLREILAVSTTEILPSKSIPRFLESHLFWIDVTPRFQQRCVKWIPLLRFYYYRLNPRTLQKKQQSDYPLAYIW